MTDEDGDEVTTTVAGAAFRTVIHELLLVQGTVSTSAAAQDYTVTVSASDGVNTAVTGTFTISVTEPATTPPANSPPQITVPGNQTYEQGETITAIDFKVTDEDGDEVTTTVSGAPSGLSYTNSLLQGTVSASATAQDYTVTVSADDGANAAVTGSFTISVTEPATTPPANSPPEITVPGNQTYEQGETITAIDFKVTDVNGDEVTTTVSGLPSGLSYTNSLVQGTVSASATVQDYTVTVSASDGVNPAVKGTFTITVTEPATTPPAISPPVITNPGDKTYVQGETIAPFRVVVSRSNGRTVKVRDSGLPSGLRLTFDPNFNPETDSSPLHVKGTVSANAEAKDYTVTITADDGVNAAVTATFTITVTAATGAPPANSPPVITSPGNKWFEQGETITAFGIPVTDADGDGLGISMSGLPSGLSWSWDENSESIQVTGTVSASAAAKAYTVTVEANEVSDTDAAVEASFTITVTDPNSAPANSPPEIGKPLVVYGIQYQKIWPFDIPVSDPNGDAVTVTVTGLPPGLSFSDGKVRGTPMADQPRIPALTDRLYTYTVMADDGVNPVVTRTFEYFVVYAPPRITVPGDTTYAQGETITAFDITVDADPKYKTVEVTGLPGGLSYTNGQVQGTVSPDAELKDYTITITADGDGVGGAIDYPPQTATFTITVRRPEDGPTVAIAGPADLQSGAFDVTITFSESVTGFEQSDVTVSNGAVTAFSGSGGSYTATITPAASGTVTVDVPAGVATGGEENGNEAASQFSVNVLLPRWIRFDGPTTVRTTEDPFQVQVIFSESPESYSFEPLQKNSTISYTREGPVFHLTLTPSYRKARGGSWPYECVLRATWYGARNGPATLRTDYRVWVDADPPGFWHNSGITGPKAPQIGPFEIRLGVTEGNLVGFEAEDVTVVNGSVTSFRPHTDYGWNYTLQITPAASGFVRVRVGAAKFKDLAGWDNRASRTYSVLADLDAPTVGISGPTIVQNGPFDAAITFSEPVTGFEQGDVSIGNGTVTAFSGSGAAYTATVAPAATGWVTLDVAAIVAADEAGNGNASAIRYSVQADLDAPTVQIAGPADTQNGLFDATITFSEDVAGFEQGDLTVGNGTVTAFSGSGDSYSATITPAGSGIVTVDVATRAARDSAGNGNTPATRFSVHVDVDRPSASITGPAATQTGAFDVSISFSEEVTGFEQGDMTVDNGTVTAFSGSGGSYSATITPTATGLVTVDVAANAAMDAVGNGNTPADRLSVTASLDASNPMLEIIAPEDRTYAQGETITSFGIPVINTGVGESPGGAKRAFGNANPVTVMEDDLPTVTVGGLPSGLSYTSRKVGGTVSAEAAVKTYTVAINAANVNGQIDDATFRIRVTAATEVTVSDATAIEGDALSFTVRLAKAVQGGLTVTPVFGVGTANVNADYTPNTTPLRFAGTAGEEQTITVPTIEDEVVEPTETFEVSLVVSGTTAKVTATDTATGTITDDDDGGVSAPTVTVSDASAVEGEAISFAVRLTRAVQGGLTVTPVFGDVTATSGDDYTENTSALGFVGAAGEARTFTVSTIEDEVEEDVETFTLRLVVSDAPSGVSAGGGTGTITDDDGSWAATATVPDDDTPPKFDEGYAAIRSVVENSPPGTDIGVPLLATDAEDDPLSYALGGADASSFTLDPATGQLRTREPLDFETRNSYDGLTVTVDDGHGHTDVLSVTVNVIDATPPDAPDAPAVVQSSSDPESSLDVSWRAPADNGAPITDYDVRYREAGTTAWIEHGFDGGGAGATLTRLKAASTYEVQVLARNVEGAGEWSVSGRGETLDPDAPRKTVKMAGAGAAEGAGLTFAVILNRAVPGGLTVTPRFSDGTAARGPDYAAKFTHRFSDRRATRGTDYAVNETGMRFQGRKGERHTFTVTTIQDDVVEYNETFTVRLDISETSTAGLTGGSATGTITDDDSGTVSTGNRKASEGDGLTFRVKLNRAVQGGLTVTPVFKDGTATEGIDYTASASPLSFNGTAGETRSFTVATTEDDNIEENETFTVGLRVSNAPRGVTAGEPVTGTIIDDDGRNEPPDFDDAGHATTRAVAENTPAGGPVGDPVAATDANGDILSYTLSGSDAFSIDSENGQITVSEGASLDYEAGPLSYAVTVTVNDGREGNDAIEVVISVTDVAEPPAAPGAPRVTGASLSSVQVHWRAPENTGPAVSDYDVQYRKQDAADWTSHAFTGTKNTSEIQGLESGANYDVQVRAKNAEGAGAWSEPGSGRTRVNTAPVAVDDVVTVFRGRRATSLSTGDTRDVTRNPSATPPEDFDIPEPEAGAKIAPLAKSASATESENPRISVLANDVDAEDDRSRLTAILVEAPAHGILTLYENGTFIYAHDGSRAAEDRFTYRVLDSGGASSDVATVTIAITGVNLGPAVTGAVPDQILTMGTNGRVDLTGLFADPDGDPLNYEVSSDNGIVNASLVGKVIALTPLAVSTARVTVTARDPYGLSAKLSFAVTVENAQTNRARALELSLAAFGRTVLSQTVDAIAGRFEATSRALRATLDGSRLVLGQAFNAMEWVNVAARLFGVTLDAPVSRSAFQTAAPAGLPGVASDPDAVRPTLRAPSGRSILTRSSFRMAMDRTGSAENGWTLWGRGAGSRYAGDARSDNRMDGRVTAAYVGADYHWGSKLTLGVAASYSNGLQDFDNAGESTGKWRTRLASLRPYLHWSPTGKLCLWGMLGFGRGDAELNSGYGGPLAGTGSSTVETDISSRSAALGGRMDLTRVGNVDLALTADAFVVSTVSDAVAGLRATTGDARRVRMMVNGSTGWSVTPDTRMDMSLALGARVDGGDVETGLGAELAGALALSNRRIGLDVEVRSHWLAAHQEGDFREGGLSLALRLDPGSDREGDWPCRWRRGGETIPPAALRRYGRAIGRWLTATAMTCVTDWTGVPTGHARPLAMDLRPGKAAAGWSPLSNWT